MKEYEIKVYWECCGTVKVEAESLTEAINKAKDGPLPQDQDYVSDSFEIEIDQMVEKYDEDYVEEK
jgi:hypothetical protein